MKKRRLLLALLLVAAMSLPLFAVACNNNTNPDTTAGDTTDATEEKTTADTTELPSTEATTEAETEATTVATTEPVTQPETETDTSAPDTTEVETDVTETETEDSSLPDADTELSITEILTLGQTLAHGSYTEGKYFVTGIMQRSYSNNVVIVDEDGNELTVYGAFSADGQIKFKDMTDKPEKGDIVTVYGVIGNNNGTARVKDGWIVDFYTPEPNTTEADTDEITTEAVFDETTEAITEADTTEATTTAEITEIESTETETETKTEAETPAETTETVETVETVETTETQVITEQTTEAPEVENIVYNNGKEISDAGADWQRDFFANVKHSVDESLAVSITAEELLEKMVISEGEGALKAGEVWLVTETIVLASDTKYYGNGAAIIAEGGIVIKDAVDVSFKNAIIKGEITIEGSAQLYFYKLDITSSDAAISFVGSCSDIEIKACRITGKTAAVVGESDNLTFYQSYACADNAISLEGDGIIVQDSKIVATGCGVAIVGDDCIIRENTVTVLSTGCGIAVTGGSRNTLVALNDVQGPQVSILVDEVYNCSVVLNRAIIIKGTGSTSLYVIENSVGGHLYLKDNNYLIAEGNTYLKDGLDHSERSINNSNTNGDNITNVDHRVEVGANEEILPHTNKDLFLGMDRKTVVSDASFDELKALGTYITDCGSQSDIVIVPPGAYACESIVYLGSGMSNKTVYAYGVYQEHLGKAGTNQLYVDNANNINVYGLTIGYVVPPSGQVRVVEKYFCIGDDPTKYYSEADLNGKKPIGTRTYHLTVVADAGFFDGFTTTNPERFHTWWPEMFFVDENGEYSYACEENPKSNHTTTRNDDGTMTITLTAAGTLDVGEGKGAVAIWNRVTLGTVITCRLVRGANSIAVAASKNVNIKDVTVYGYAAAMSVFTFGKSENVNFIRYADTTQSGRVIDKETYDKYLEIEEKWGIDFELRELNVDGNAVYVGAPSRSTSVDAFHVAGATTGVNIISTIVESMVDDGSNQHSESARLHDYEINGDTVTLYYKDCAAGVSWGSTANEGSMGGTCCSVFEIGDIIYIYTPDGRTVCEAPVLSVTEQIPSMTISQTISHEGKNVYFTAKVYKVTVAREDFNETLLDIYDLSDNHFSESNRITVDNLSRNSCNYTIDNSMVRNGHSRGFLIKSRNVVIKHCTFRNVSYSAILIRSETEWVESTLSKDIVIQQCLFDNTGFIYNGVHDRGQACIRIQGTSTSVSEGSLPIDNIIITGCKFTNNTQRTAIWINSAQNVKITNNIFDDVIYNIIPQSKGKAVLLDTCMNIEISDNTYNYAHYNGDITKVISGVGTSYANIFGTDVTNEDGTPIFPDVIK